MPTFNLRQLINLLPLLLGFFQTNAQAATTWTAKDLGTTTAPNGYWEFLPDAYHADPTGDFPVLIFLHGAGHGANSPGNPGLPNIQNTGLNKVLNTASHNLHSYFDQGDVLVLSPQAPGNGWSAAQIRAFLDYVVSEYRVDRQRIYMTGLSAGSAGISRFIKEDPDAVEVTAFLATATVSPQVEDPGAAFVGPASPYWAVASHGNGRSTAFGSVDLLAGHVAGTTPTDAAANYPGNGSADHTASYDANSGWTWESGRVPTINGTPRVTIMDGGLHNTWDRAYSTQGIFDWLFSHIKPTVTISSPTDNLVSPLGANITLTGSSVDSEGNTIAGSSIFWRSSIDGDLGAGSSITVNNLSPGVHSIYCTGIDSGNRGGRTAVTVIVPNDQPFTANIDFGTLEEASEWNTFDDHISGSIKNILDPSSAPTGLRIDVQTPFAARGTNGSFSTDATPNVYPENVQKDHFYTSSSTPVGELLIRGLSPGQAYDFTFFGSRDQGGTSNLLARYTLGSQYTTLQTRENTNQTASINNYVADASGQVVLHVERDQSVSSSIKAYLSSLIITTQGSGGTSNFAPVANNDAATTDEGVTVTINVLANDSDSDGPNPLSIASFTSATNGGIVIVSDELVYTPNAGFSGTDTFDYTITDGEDTATATVNVTVNEVITPPLGGSLFSQDFESSTIVGDYVSATPDSGQFDDISAETSAGTWSLSNGQLQITRTGSSNDAGLSRVNDSLLGNPEVVKVSVELAISNVPSTWSELFVIELGDWPSVADYGSGGNLAYLYERMQIKGDDTGEFKVVIDGQTSTITLADGTVKRLTWYINNGASATSYTGLESINPVSHNLAANSADVWIDDVLVLTATSVGSAAAINDFRVRMSSNVAYTVGFESISISGVLDEATNAPPTPVNDTIATDEGQPVAINVLGNDTDPDGGPGTLTLVSADAASSGSAVVNGNQIDYTPNPGFYGIDSFSYTISDGADTASALVTITVNDTSTAGNLSSANLSGFNIGQGVGSSRVLASGTWELNALGTGAAGTLDASYGEFETVDGDFSVVARIQDLGPYGTAPVAGLTVRESTTADSVMLQFGIDVNNSYYQANRASTGANATTSTPAGTASLPNGWLMIERVGDTLSLATSTDGVSYVVIDTVILSGLANSLQVGLFAQSGDNTDYARVLVSDYALESAYAVFVQDFSSSAILADYISATPSANIFDDISAESAGGTWSISSGTLSIDRTGASAGGTNDAGFSRITDIIGDPALLKVSFDLSMNNIPKTWSPLMHVEVGAWSTLGDYGSGGNLAYLYDRIDISGNDTGNFRLRFGSTSSATYAADGTPHTVTWYMNRSTASANYVGPDAQTYSLAAGTFDLWVDTTAQFTAQISGNYSGNTVEDFRVRIPSAFDLNATFDNIIIEDQF